MLTAILVAMSMSMAPPLGVGDARCRLLPDRVAAMMAAGYEAFDQAVSGALGWREVMARGCYRTAADLARDYLTANRATLDAGQVRTLNFHIGQILAFGGEQAAAAPYFAAARGGDGEWDAYVASQRAFVKHDRTAFEAARSRYVKIAPGSQRRAFLDSQSACFDRPFMDALACPAAGD